MPNYIAFYDVDDTLIQLKSMQSFLFDFIQQRHPRDAAERLEQLRTQYQFMRTKGWAREDMNVAYYQRLRGYTLDEIETHARLWYEKVRQTPDFFHRATLETLRHHQREGAAIAFVSGSFQALLQPLAADLGVSHILCAPLELEAGVLTGRLLSEPYIGQGKRLGMEALLARHGMSAQECWAYADDASDLPMLEAVGHPCVVGRDATLGQKARERFWPILNINV